MSLPPDVAANIAENDRILRRWLLIALTVFMCLASAFVFWRIAVARANWFEQIAHVDADGVNVIAEVKSTRCKYSHPVNYRWYHEGNEYVGSGAPCNNSCQELRAGDMVDLRFVPARPNLFACMPGDIRRDTEAPRYLDALIPLIFVICFVFVKLFEAYREPPAPD
jgi:hypothetical protein